MRITTTCAQTKTRSSTRGAGIAPETQFERNDACAGHSFRPAAMRAACQPRSVRTTSAIIARMKSASPRCEPSKRAGRTTLRIHDGRHDAGEHEQHEDVDERHEPALRAEPRDRPAAIDRADHRHHDRREEDEEAPEDRGVHDARHQPLEQLPLAEHDHRLVPHPAGDIVAAVERLGGAHEPREEERAAREEPSRDGERGGERQRARGGRYVPRTFLSSAVIAGTISCRSPITA